MNKKIIKDTYFINESYEREKSFYEECNIKIIDCEIEDKNYTDKEILIINLDFICEYFEWDINSWKYYDFSNKIKKFVKIKNKFLFLINKSKKFIGTKENIITDFIKSYLNFSHNYKKIIKLEKNDGCFYFELNKFDSFITFDVINNLFFYTNEELLSKIKKLEYKTKLNEEKLIKLRWIAQNETHTLFSNLSKIKLDYKYLITDFDLMIEYIKQLELILNNKSKKSKIEVLFKLNGTNENCGFKLINENIFILNLKDVDVNAINIFNLLIKKYTNKSKKLFDRLEQFVPKHIEIKYQKYNNLKNELLNKKNEETQLKNEIEKEIKFSNILYSKDSQLENDIFNFLEHKDFEVEKDENTNINNYDLLIKLEGNVFVPCEVKCIKNKTLKISYFSQLSNWEDKVLENFKEVKKQIPLLIFTSEYDKKPNERKICLPTEKLNKIKIIENLKIISTYNLYKILNKENGKKEFIEKLKFKNNFENKNTNKEIKEVIEIK